MKPLYAFNILILLLTPVLAISLRINEVCSDNQSVIADYYGNYSDWIEIYNTTNDTIDLHLYCLSDSPDNLTKYRFPEGSTIEPGQIKLIWAINNVTPTIDPNGDFWGTNFAVSANGEPVYLTLFDGLVVIDQMPAISIPTDISYGRMGNGNEWYFFTEPTPRAENTSQGYTLILADPVASHVSGWYDTSVEVNFTSPQAGAQILYTTDGSEPSDTSPLWTGPMTLYDRSSEPNVISLIPTVLPDLPEPVNELDWWFPPASNIPKIHTLKARCFGPGALPSKTITRTYMVGIDLYDIPIVSLVMEPDDLFDNDLGIYVAGNGYDGIHFLTANFMQNWDRPVDSEWFDATGNLIYQKRCDVEIHGQYTARAGMKSLKLKTPDNPTNYISYPFFGTEYLNSFRYLILRNSGNDVHQTLFRDYFVQNLLAEQNLDVVNYTPYIVFLNGEYWGIHNLQEHMEEHFVSGHYNIPLNELDVLEKNLTILNGDSSDYSDLLIYLEQNDVTNPSVWQYLETKIDMQNLLEYLAGEIFCGNTDWPENNVRYWRKRVPFTPGETYGNDGRWRWLVYDMDFSFGLYQNPYWEHDTLSRALNPDLGWSTFLFRSLIQNQGFKNEFINTISDRLNYNWLPSKIISSIDQFEDQFETSIPQHIERWSMPSYIASWVGEVNALRIFAINRPAFLQNLVVDQFDLPGTANFSLLIQPENAAVIRMNDRVDLNAGDYIYFQGIPVTMQAIPNPGWDIVSFNGLQTDSLTINPVAEQTIQLILQETVLNEDEVQFTEDLWSIRISPNPIQKSTSILKMNFLGTGYEKSEELKFALYNVKGQELFTRQVPISALKSGEWSTSIQGLPAGIYIIKLFDNKSTKSIYKIAIV